MTSLGRVAYEAWVSMLPHSERYLDWSDIPTPEVNAWEEAGRVAARELARRMLGATGEDR